MADERLEMIAFQIISHVGTAKSLVMEALYAAKEGDFVLAEEKIEESKKYFVEGHKVHASLIQKEAAGDKVEYSLLFMHAEDQLMSTETISELVKEMIEMYKKFGK
ncbi:PTS lactose/cellobiose transporter subunit IIA [Neobacillus sp. MM2021_6]|uniref:PTS lactose/cellobiose transporter subunit IIA n=1 Tax=Bacillaceae TaxID=186817 RepID=UPI0014081DD2|nr:MULTISPECIES: PTS lactose/cellobiose transporter subunit IIA [Bacillaceae]MBO0961351.1 PTS lactose/cellobiose transporter subunit IIA [Neobacillus sp. MM2021_6]NHC20519.1 PTS lactose/cellobiose transporter subunit IIA [Bacillus sp. MM2020_4]